MCLHEVVHKKPVAHCFSYIFERRRQLENDDYSQPKIPSYILYVCMEMYENNIRWSDDSLVLMMMDQYHIKNSLSCSVSLCPPSSSSFAPIHYFRISLKTIFKWRSWAVEDWWWRYRDDDGSRTELHTTNDGGTGRQRQRWRDSLIRYSWQFCLLQSTTPTWGIDMLCAAALVYCPELYFD